jgi:hypothetical protein
MPKSCPMLLAVVLFAAPSLARADESRCYAGIEVGGKGVKAIVVEAVPGGLYKRLFAKTHNHTLSILKAGAFDKDAMDDAVAAIKGFIKTITTQFKAPEAKIIVMGSSGLPKASNRDDFVAAVKKATGKEMRFIDDRTEVELTIAGVVPKEDRAKSISLDIGSGNTKGGYKPAGSPLVYVAVPLGTETFTQRVKKEAADKGIPFAEAAAKLSPIDLVAPLSKGAKLMPELEKRRRVYLSGGLIWAMISLVKPAEVARPYVKFRASDVEAFQALVVKSDGYPSPDFGKIDDERLRKWAEKEWKNVTKVYTKANLVAGAEILSALVKSFDLKDRTLIFPRNGYVGWLAAYIAGEKLDDPADKPKERREKGRKWGRMGV